MSQRFEGRNLEEALENAASTLGVPRYRVGHRVLLEKRGFLGGVKRIVIEAFVHEESEEQPPAVITLPSAPPSRPERKRDDRARGPRERSRGRRDEPRESRGNDRGGRRQSNRRDEEIPEQETQSAFALEVGRWTNELLRLTRLDAEIRTVESPDNVEVSLYGPDAHRFVNRGGELLDAFQTVANKTLSVREDYKPLEFDALNFKQQRLESLGDEARRLADLVRETGNEQMMQAMNPFERRVVHLALSTDADVTTESRGDGFFKRVAVIPRGEAKQPSVR